jgi:hypothetical protein
VYQWRNCVVSESNTHNCFSPASTTTDRSKRPWPRHDRSHCHCGAFPGRRSSAERGSTPHHKLLLHAMRWASSYYHQYHQGKATHLARFSPIALTRFFSSRLFAAPLDLSWYNQISPKYILAGRQAGSKVAVFRSVRTNLGPTYEHARSRSERRHSCSADS